MIPWIKTAVISGLGFIVVFGPAVQSPDYPESMDTAFNLPVIFGIAALVGAWEGMENPRNVSRNRLKKAFGYGLSVMALYPVWSIIDAMINPAAHTLLGVELMIFLVLGATTGMVSLVLAWSTHSLIRKLGQ